MVDKARSLIVEKLNCLIFRKELTKESIKNIAYLIWAIDHFGRIEPDAEMRVGIGIPGNEDFQELVIRINEEVFWLGIEAIHRTGAGSDSYEIEYFVGHPDWSFENDLSERFDGDGITAFVNLFEELIKEDHLIARTEYHGDYKTD